MTRSNCRRPAGAEWKLHEYFEDGRLELYNLGKDLNERQDLSDSLPGVAEQLHQKLVKWRSRTQAPVPAELNPAFINPL